MLTPIKVSLFSESVIVPLIVNFSWEKTENVDKQKTKRKNLNFEFIGIKGVLIDNCLTN